MPIYRYSAIGHDGALVRGKLEASSPQAVALLIRSQNGYLIAAKATRPGLLHPGKRSPDRHRWSIRELALFTQELGALLAANVPLDNALTILAGLGEIKAARKTIEQILAQVRQGASLAEALRQSGCFPPMYVSMVRAGETGGNLEQTVAQLAEYLTASHAIRQSVISALIYPALLVFTAIASIAVILIFVVPAFAPLFRSAGKKLPASAQFLLGLSEFMDAYWWLVALLLLGTTMAIAIGSRQAAIRPLLDKHLLGLPLLGKLLGLIQVERFCRIMAALVANGVAVPAGLTLAQGVLSNRLFSEEIGKAAQRIREGESLARHLSRSRLFPSSTLDFIRIGEETGRLDLMLARHADFCARNIKHSIERLLAIMVPALTIVLGMIIAGLIATILVSILSVNELAL